MYEAQAHLSNDIRISREGTLASVYILKKSSDDYVWQRFRDTVLVRMVSL